MFFLLHITSSLPVLNRTHAKMFHYFMFAIVGPIPTEKSAKFEINLCELI